MALIVLQFGSVHSRVRCGLVRGTFKCARAAGKGAGSLEVMKVGKPKKVKKAVWHEALWGEEAFWILICGVLLSLRVHRY